MSQENVELAGQFVAAFNSQDVAVLTAGASAEIEWETLTGNAVTGTVYRGHDGIRQYFEDIKGIWSQIAIEMTETRDLGDDGVLLLATLRARGSTNDIAVEMPFASLFQFRQAKVQRIKTFPDHRTGLAAVGLVE